jgi:hypothetical protein
MRRWRWPILVLLCTMIAYLIWNTHAPTLAERDILTVFLVARPNWETLWIAAILFARVAFILGAPCVLVTLFADALLFHGAKKNK